MAERRTLICDECGAEEPWDGDNDTWFGAKLDGEDAVDYRGRSRARLMLFPLNTYSERADFHLCGAACVTRKVSEFLGQAVAAS